MAKKDRQWLDLRGEICPMPVLKTRKALEQMNKGEVLEIVVDYPLAKENIQRTIDDVGEEVIDLKEEGHTFHIFVRKRSES